MMLPLESTRRRGGRDQGTTDLVRTWRRTTVAIAAILALVGPGSTPRVLADSHAEPGAAAPAAKLPAEIRVGISPNYPPVAFMRDGKIVGIEADFAAELAKLLGSKLTLAAVPWDELSGALAGKEVDVIMSGVSVTPRRKNLAHFTAPYLKVGQMALIRQDDLTRLSGADAMNQKGVKVGVERLTTGARYARENLMQATIVEFDSVDDGLEALRDKKVDFFIHDAPTVWRVSGRFEEADEELVGLYRPLTDEEIAWAVRKDDAATLGAALDGALAKLQGNGKAQEILDRWIPVRKVSKGAEPKI